MKLSYNNKHRRVYLFLPNREFKIFDLDNVILYWNLSDSANKKIMLSLDRKRIVDFLCNTENDQKEISRLLKEFGFNPTVTRLQTESEYASFLNKELFNPNDSNFKLIPYFKICFGVKPSSFKTFMDFIRYISKEHNYKTEYYCFGKPAKEPIYRVIK